MAITVEQTNRKISDNNGAPIVHLPKLWTKLTGLEPSEDCIVSLEEGKHGHFIAIYNKKFQLKTKMKPR